MTHTENNPAIVVSAYNRAPCLLRLLASLENAEYPESQITLVISIDKGDNEEVLKVAEKFQWSHGEKRIIAHRQHLNLAGHILSCGDLTNEYGRIILFEDDLLASKYFYAFAAAALRFYESDTRIAGISLYSYDIAEIGFNPFAPVDDGNDVYFMQVASSWGQAWTREQWQGFRAWFQQHPVMHEQEQPPVYLFTFSENSWKKHYIRYLHFAEKYFVFPRYSLSTNFEEPGTTTKTKGLYQVPLQQAKRAYQFVELEQSRSVYDAYFEMAAACLKKWNAQLSPYDFTTDIYGNHPALHCKSTYLLTTKPAKNPLLTFALEMFPGVLNVINNVHGDAIKLVKREDVLSEKVPNDLSYFKYKTVSEIIFQEQLIERIEQVHAVNSENVRLLHQEYIQKMEGLNREIRNLNSSYHAQLAQLHRDYEVKMEEKVTQALQQYQFNLDYPLFKLLTVAEHTSPDVLLNTIRAVQKHDYPRFHHHVIFVGSANALPVSEFPASTFTLHEVRDRKEALDTAATYLNEECDIHCWLEAGTMLLPKAMLTVREIFKRFAEVNWLKGVPAHLGASNEIIPENDGIDYRWSRTQFCASPLADLQRKISGSGIFWKKHLWKRVGGNFNPQFAHIPAIELFSRFYEADMLYVAMAYLAAPGNQRQEIAPEASNEFNLLREKFPQQGGLRQALSKVSSPFFRRDIPVLRAAHQALNHYPPLIRFDYHTQSFYLSAY